MQTINRGAELTVFGALSADRRDVGIQFQPSVTVVRNMRRTPHPTNAKLFTEQPELDVSKADTYIYLKADQTALVPLNPPLPTWQDKPGPWHAFVLIKPTFLRPAEESPAMQPAAAMP